MAEKFLTTDRKRWIASLGTGITGWHALTAGANPLNIPFAFPAWAYSPILGGFSLFTAAGIVTLSTIFLLWTEY